ncbi:TadE/TadG family type IV pilus assembly protein [Ruegeria sp. HKCCA5491]|uniref:TadE/TadG family type IV pilus assembly protein n=1 Tax=Ruegeria sp. HKCCA5491 TaxID=2682986 RepID=UPI001487FD08|nr:hypothetical protein [Ruegeria sp. HKCCA5491]
MFVLNNEFKFRLRRAIGRFVRDTSGAALVEMGFALPILILLTTGALVVQDAVRMSYLRSKATYTVSDMISREDTFIDADYFNGLNSVFRYIVGPQHPSELRISTIECTADCQDEAQRVLEFCWSHPSSGLSALTNDQIASYEARTPLFSEGDTLLMTEAFLDYTPLFGDFIMSPQTYQTVAFTRPRIAGQIKFDTGAVDTDGSTIVRDCFNN